MTLGTYVLRFSQTYDFQEHRRQQSELHQVSYVTVPGSTVGCIAYLFRNNKKSS